MSDRIVFMGLKVVPEYSNMGLEHGFLLGGAFGFKAKCEAMGGEAESGLEMTEK